MKNKILLLATSLLLLVTTSCKNTVSIGTIYRYNNSDKYTIINEEASFENNEITTIDVDWIYGNIDIIYDLDSASLFTIKEDNGYSSQAGKGRYYIDNSTLYIRFFENNAGLINLDKSKNKNLTITLPQKDYSLINIDTISTDTICDINANKITCDSVSGNFTCNANPGNIDIDNVSGNIYINPSNPLSFNVEIDTVSGDSNFILHETSDFKVDLSSVSGSINSDFSLTNNSYGKGTYLLNVDSVSGSVNINKL
ncbi:MAG: DUF4097 family beta strand repeat-containing protein [Bacilli bacterium]